MFTGIINGQGKLLAVESRGHETRFRIQALYDLADIILGESIAVNVWSEPFFRLCVR